MDGDYIGEVVESSTAEFVAESRVIHCAPPFGSFVRVPSDVTIFGLVFNVVTRSIEPNRRPSAYGMTEEELRYEQPQIFELLRTEFHAFTVGYSDESKVKQILPPSPPPIHSFVYLCSDEEIRDFTSNYDFLRTLVGNSKTPPDELIIAAVRNTLRVRGEDGRYVVQVGKELSKLIRDDYDRLSSMLRRIVL